MAERKIGKKIRAAVEDPSSGLQSLLTSAEDLLGSVKNQPGAAAAQLRERLSDTISKARDHLDDFDAREAAAESIDTTVGFIRNEPWRSVAIGAIAVLAVTLLLRLGSDD